MRIMEGKYEEGKNAYALSGNWFGCLWDILRPCSCNTKERRVMNEWRYDDNTTIRYESVRRGEGEYAV
jgi:hypothetical protein